MSLASSSLVFFVMSYFIFVSSKYSFQPPGVSLLVISSSRLLLFFTFSHGYSVFVIEGFYVDQPCFYI